MTLIYKRLTSYIPYYKFGIHTYYIPRILLSNGKTIYYLSIIHGNISFENIEIHEKLLQQTIRNDLHRFWRIYCKTVNIILGCCKNRVVVYALWEESIFPSTHLHKSFSSFIGQPLMDIRETVTDTNNFLSCITTPPLLYFICSLILFRFFSYLKQKRCEISSM